MRMGRERDGRDAHPAYPASGARHCEWAHSKAPLEGKQRLSLAQGPELPSGRGRVTTARKDLLENLLGPPRADVSASRLPRLPALQLGREGEDDGREGGGRGRGEELSECSFSLWK